MSACTRAKAQTRDHPSAWHHQATNPRLLNLSPVRNSQCQCFPNKSPKTPACLIAGIEKESTQETTDAHGRSTRLVNSVGWAAQKWMGFTALHREVGGIYTGRRISTPSTKASYFYKKTSTPQVQQHQELLQSAIHRAGGRAREASVSAMPRSMSTVL